MNSAVVSTPTVHSEARNADVAQPHVTVLSSGARLCLLPRLTIDRERFTDEAAGPAIAIDGYVRGASWVDYGRKLANFNHHEEVGRATTFATCGQIKHALKNGFVEEFSVEGRFAPAVWGNDADEDVCLTIWLIDNFQRVRGGRSEPLINQIVEIENNLDMTGGCYPYDPHSPILRRVAWVFAPYAEARRAGRIAAMDGAEMANLIASVGDRISRFSLGRGEELALDTRIEVLGGGPGWNLIAEHGYHARLTLAGMGIRGFVSARPLAAGRFQYSIGKSSAYSSFPVDELYGVLNEAEGLTSGEANRWSGSDTIGGSPRQGGSRLSPAEVEAIINLYLSRRRDLPRAA